MSLGQYFSLLPLNVYLCEISIVTELLSMALILGWGSLVGLIFSSVGAAGGILASFGLISVIGVADPNSVKPMAQLLTLATALVFIPGYYQRRSWVLPLGLLLSAGGVVGAIIGSTVSSHYLADMTNFKPLFGLLALAVSIQLGLKVWREKQAGIVSRAYCENGVREMVVRYSSMEFVYGEQFYRINTRTAVLAGFLVAFVASIFGVGGGFLLVPFMSSFLRMPMYIVPATAAIAVSISSAISVSNYLRMGSELDYSALILLVAGGVAGSYIGPKLNRVLKDSWLQLLLACIVLMIGIKYLA